MRTLSIDALRRRFGGSKLSQKVMSGSFWTLAHYGGQQALRFISNVILTRLLAPEAFGLMLLVNTVIQGLEMFSDVGTRASIVQSARGEDAEFLRTAYTVKVLRGLGLGLIAALAGYPAAVFFDKPELVWVMPAVGLRPALMGLSSMRLLVAQRDLRLREVVTLELGVQLINIGVTVAVAMIYPNVWALVIGAILSAALQTAGSHLLSGPRDRFGWDREGAREMFRFGRWIFFSTALAYLTGRGDVLVMGRMLTAAELGIFGLAVNLAQVPSGLIGQLGSKVLFPAYSQVNREAPANLRNVVRRSRILLMLGNAALFAPLVLLGHYIVDIVYDESFKAAGWILQTVSCGYMTAAINRSYDGLLHAKGMSYESTLLQTATTAMKFAAFGLGFHFFGLPGFIVGMSYSHWLSYPFTAHTMRKAGVWQPGMDALALAISAAITVAFFSFGPEQLAFDFSKLRAALGL